MHRLALLSFVLLPACVWVTDVDVENRKPEMDDDGDGAPAYRDCNDADPTVNPDASEELWYNGVDNNCDGKDDYDQDEDGYVATEYVGLTTAGVATSGALPGGDCDDVAPRISPQQPDTWYDGVDQNCDGRDDYDQDGDGYVRRDDAGLATQYVEGSGALPAGDCNDTDGAYRPGRDDAWYDGLDMNCDRKDDYDQDEDGWVRAEDAGKPTAGVDRSGALPAGDCDDTDDTIQPGATDAWYDGVDSDCRGDDDFDQDLDGVTAEAAGGTDCDDAAARTYPGALETLGDGVDSDCALGDDGVVLAPVTDVTWTNIRRIGLVASDARVYLGIAANAVATTSLSLNDAVVFYNWRMADVSPDAGSLVLAFPGSSSATYELDDAAFQARTGTSDWFYVSFAAHDSTRRQYFTGEYDVVATSGARTRSVSGSDASTTVPVASVANAFDASGVLHAIYCEASIGTTRWTRFASTGSTFSGLSSGDQTDYSTNQCALYFDGASPRVLFGNADTRDGWYYSMATYDVGGTYFELTELMRPDGVRPLDLRVPRGFAAGSLLVVDANSGTVVLTDASTGTIHTFPDAAAVQADAMMSEDGVVFVTWVNEDGEAWLARDDGAGAFTLSPLYTDARATQASVWADGDNVVAAVAGTSELAFISMAR